MMYRLLEWISGIMVHWFYSEIRIEGAECIPGSGPMLVAVNHPNALVDSLIAGCVVPRRLRFTAKATLMENPGVALVFRMLGVVPLRRAADRSGSAREDALRNNAAFDEIVSALHAGGSVLIFPEGKSNGDGLHPLRTGLARIALEARRSGVSGLNILPIGLNFEDKGAPGSRVIAQVGEPINVDSWHGDLARELTDLVAARLSSLSSGVVFTEPSLNAPRRRRGVFIRIASWWGRTTHEIPVRCARSLAVARSKSADEPAMLTMLYGVGLVTASYAIHIAVIGILTRSVLLSALYLAALIAGARFTAFEAHRR